MSKKVVYSQEDYEDDLSIYTSEAKENNSYFSPRGMGLDLSLVEKSEYIEEENVGIQETPILVIFDLPDGSQGENMFKLGNTVEVLKSVIESDYGIPMAKQDLYLEDQRLMDPLSLLDYPDVKGVDELYVRVEGPMASGAKK